MARKKLSIKVDPVEATRFAKSFARVIDTLASADDLQSLDVIKMRRDANSLVRSFNKMWPDENERTVAAMRIMHLHNSGLLRFLAVSNVASEHVKQALAEAKVLSRQKPQKKRA